MVDVELRLGSVVDRAGVDGEVDQLGQLATTADLADAAVPITSASQEFRRALSAAARQ